MALAVTIAVIIILSTVLINAAFGDGGVIKQSQTIKDTTSNVITSENEDTNRVMQEYANVMAEDGEGEETPEEPEGDLGTVADILKAGDRVIYPAAQGGNVECAVLYDSSSSYGVEIIAMESVEYVTLGSSSFSTSMNSYNSAISTLNSAASDYNNGTYSSRARCVGSNPSNPTSDSPGYFTSSYSYMSSYNGQFKNQDTHYETDCNRMGTLGIRAIDDVYWLASRSVPSGSDRSYFSVRSVRASGDLNDNYFCYVISSGSTYSNSYEYGLRPIFLLRSNIKVTGGTGEIGNAYTLGT